MARAVMGGRRGRLWEGIEFEGTGSGRSVAAVAGAVSPEGDRDP